MPATNVLWPPPLTRFPTLWPGQMGVPGTDHDRGERMHCTGEIFYVDPNFPGASDARDGTSPTDPLLTVAAALTKCQAYRGDVVAVMANNGNPYADVAQGYNTIIQEAVTVTVPGVRIVGINLTSSIGVVWAPVNALSTCITIYANDVTVEGFFFAGAGRAIYAEYDGTDYFADYTTVRHCYFDGGNALDVAIALEYTWYCNIHDNVFMESDEHGIYVDPAGSGIAYCTIHHNIFHDCAVAMAVNNCDDSHIFANSFYNANAQGGGAATNEGIDLTGGARNQVYGNFFSCALPGAGAGDIDDLCTGVATDAWIANHCLNGLLTTTPT